MKSTNAKISFFAEYLACNYKNIPSCKFTILTPNQRLASYLHQELVDYNLLYLPKTFWQTPKICPLSTWLISTWENLPNKTVLLNTHQEHALWERIIKSYVKQEKLNLFNAFNHTLNATNLNQLITDVANARNCLHNFQMPLSKLSNYAATEEIQIFLHCAKEFEAELLKNNWCTFSNLPFLLITQLEHETASGSSSLSFLPQHLLLVGFEKLTLTPLEAKLFETLQKQGCSVAHFDPNQQSSQQHRISFSNTEEEIYAMAQWAHQLFLLSENSNSPPPTPKKENSNYQKPITIGCIVPNLHLVRDRIERIFTSVFTPKNPLPFNISIGKPLCQYPIINSALAILALGKNNLKPEDLRKVLASPFIKDNWLNVSSSETIFWEKMCANNLFSINGTLKISNLLLTLKTFCPNLAKAIKNYHLALQHTPKLQAAKKWMALFTEQLQNFNWPGSRSMTSHEQQTLSRWQKLCQEFSNLDLVKPFGFSYGEALLALNNLTQKTIFQPQSQSPNSQLQNNKPKINILGTLEASGMNFDYLWIMGMDDQTLPPRPTPNPFLPLKLQQEANLPNASITRELEFCQNMLKRWQSSAQHVIYSYPLCREEQELNITPLLANIPEMTKSNLSTALGLNFNLDFSETEKIATTIYQNAKNKIEKHLDNTAPKITQTESMNIKGGCGILEAQASCPFKAFAEYRLKAKPLNQNNIKTLRGSMLHHALEYIWQNIKEQKKLAQYLSNSELESASLKSLITEAIKYSFDTIEKEFNLQSLASLLPNGYLFIEKSCAKRLLIEWLKLEEARQPFTVIAIEKEINLKIPVPEDLQLNAPIHLNLRLRIDRIDELPDGALAIIDYKSGKNTPKFQNLINSNELKEAIQLPLYGIAIEGKIAALVIAHLNQERKNPFFGVTSPTHADIFKANINQKKQSKSLLAIDLQQKIAAWKININNLAKDFIGGLSSINASDTKICQKCKLQSLCRTIAK